jgi:hypothetical protein
MLRQLFWVYSYASNQPLGFLLLAAATAAGTVTAMIASTPQNGNSGTEGLGEGAAVAVACDVDVGVGVGLEVGVGVGDGDGEGEGGAGVPRAVISPPTSM